MSKNLNLEFLKDFYLKNSVGLALGADETVLALIEDASRQISVVLGTGGLLVSAGNGGSMADAMHLAEELSGKYRNVRRALKAVALSDPSFLTCVGNDFGFEQVFARGCEALLREGDCAIFYSTSGSSLNVIEAAKTTKSLGGFVISLCGRQDSPLKYESDIYISTKEDLTTEVAQLVHTMWTHMIIELVEKNLGLQH